MKRQVAALLLSTLAVGVSAISPLTPRLSAETYAELRAALAQARFPDVAHNSVVLAITGALGLEAASRPIEYATGYPHLPIVKGHVTRVSDLCARVQAHTRLPQVPDSEAIVVEAVYCLVAPAEWALSRQVVGRP